jgi:hypothetical protein
MRRITLWLSATLTVVALATSYQAGLTGGKAGEGDHGPHGNVACVHPDGPK